MKKFEYMITYEADESKLNEFGEDGWELVAVSRGKLYFKREFRLMGQIAENMTEYQISIPSGL